jgi:hypothetical protein
MLSFPNLNPTTRSFIGNLLTNNLQVLSNNDAELFWKEKENIQNLQFNAHEQLGIYNSVVTRTMQKAYAVRYINLVLYNYFINHKLFFTSDS